MPPPSHPTRPSAPRRTRRSSSCSEPRATSPSAWSSRPCSTSIGSACFSTFAVIGNGRGDVSDDEFRDEARKACERAADGELDEEAWGAVRPAPAVRRPRVHHGGRAGALPGGPRGGDRGAGWRATAAALPLAATRPVRADRRHRRPRPRPTSPGRVREAVRYLRDPRSTARRRRAQGPRRAPDPPHRPLPGQGGHPATCTRCASPTASSPAPGTSQHRGGPDRRPRDARRGRPRQLLRPHRGPARHDRHPPDPAGRRGGHGTAPLARPR